MPTAPPISRRLTAAAFARDGGEGQWVTIRGVHIQIGKGGKIVAGPAHLVGKPVSHLAEHQKGDQVIHRQHGPAMVTKVSHIGDGRFAYNVKTAAGKEDLAFGPELSRGGGEQYPAPTPTAKSAPAATAVNPVSLSAAPLPEFAGRVQRIADRQPVKFGDKAYISHVMRDAIAEDPSLTEAAFKNKLKAAATAGHVELSRADLSGLHDPPTVAASYVNREPGMDATAMGTGGNHGLPVGTSAHMIRTGIRRHAMSRTDAEPLDVLTFDRGRFDAAAIANSDLGPGEVVAPKEGEATDSLGHPILYVEKPMLEVGGVADTDEGRMVITAEALELADRCTREWIKDGGKPFIPRGHRNFDENYNLGWLKDTKFDGKRLLGRHQLIGADAHLAAARNDSSVLLRWNFRHGGKVYPLIVEHNAILPDPKMRGLGEFVALGREGQSDPERVPVWTFVTMMGRGEAGGHWITLEGRHILIPHTAGIVPARVKAEPGAIKRFTRANLEKAITDHHREKSGESGEYTTGMERELTEAAGDANDAFRFHKKLPTEIKDAIGENPALRRVFTTTDDAKKAHGSDAFSALGDRYIDIAEARAGSPLRQAKAFARSSGDPEAAFVPHVHDNLPVGGTRSLEPVKAGGLRVGDEFTIGGKAHRVAEDEHGFRVLRSHEYGKGDVPLDAVSHVPVDKGSFRRSKVSRRLIAAASDGIPFSRRLMAFGRGEGINAIPVTCTLREALVMLGEPVPLVSRRLAFARFEGPGHWVTIDGEHVYLPGAPGSKTDGRTVISHREYDRINGPGAASRAIAEHKAKGENVGMETPGSPQPFRAKLNLGHTYALVHGTYGPGEVELTDEGVYNDLNQREADRVARGARAKAAADAKAAAEAGTVEIQTANVRKGVWEKKRVPLAEHEAWRNTPGRILHVAPAYRSHDFAGFDEGPYGRVGTTITAKKSGTAVEQGVVADRRVVGQNVEYLLKPHTKASLREYQQKQAVKAADKKVADLESHLRIHADQMSDEQTKQARADLEAARAEARKLKGG